MKTLRIQKQAFGAVSYESDNYYTYPSSGLVGLAFGSIATIEEPTFFENLLVSRQLEFAMFGVHLTRGQAEGSSVSHHLYRLRCYEGVNAWSRCTGVLRLCGLH